MIFRRLRESRAQRSKEDSKKMFFLKKTWMYFPICICIYFLSSLFVSSDAIRALLSLTLGIFPWKEIVDKIYSSNFKHLRTQLLVLLQALCTSVSSGYSLEKSLCLVRPVIEHTFGKRSVLIKPLITLENDLNVHVDIQTALSSFASNLDFPETVPVFHALGISSRIGNNSLAILRSSCQMLSEMNAVQNEISAMNAGKNAEAAMLCLMPFAITFALDKMSSDYLSSARNTTTGSILLGVAFIICIIAAALLLKYMRHSEGKISKKTLNKTITNQKGKNALPLSKIVQMILPISFISSRHELFSELSINPRQAYECYLKKQILTICLTAALGVTILSIARKPIVFALFFGLAVAILNNRDIHNKVAMKKEDIMKDIPLFLCLICTLLQAGMQLPRAIDICAAAFVDNKSIAFEIKNLKAMIVSGVSSSDAIEKLSLRIQIPEAQAALLLVARYGRLGTAEVLNLLSLQASSCWNLCRNAARKKQEREALGLLIPMTLDFISVLLVATTPAIISLGI